MFGFGRKNSKVRLEKIVDDFIKNLQCIRRAIDEQARSIGILKNNSYKLESDFFVYYFGAMIIDKTNIEKEAKQRLIGKYKNEFWKINCDGKNIQEFQENFSNRMIEYNQPFKDGEGRDYTACLIFRFLKRFNAHKPENANTMLVLYVSIPPLLDALFKYLDAVNKSGATDWRD
jgi:hypothetical protein